MIDSRLKAVMQIAYVAPLGMKFYDMVRRSLQMDLDVTVAPVSNPMRRTKAFINGNRVFVVNCVHGLNDLLQDAGSTTFWDDVSGQERPYRVQVKSPSLQFIPFSFDVPLPHRGYSVPDCMEITPPIEQPAYPSDVILLFPAANYRPPGHMALIQAQLYDPVNETPAAFAVVDALYEDALLARGVADRNGNCLLCFNYPDPNGDPLDGDSENDALQWAINLRALYTRFPPQENFPNIPDIPEFVDICRLYTQNSANLWADWAGSETAVTGKLTEITLVMGETQQLTSTTSVTTLPQSRLFITPVSP